MKIQIASHAEGQIVFRKLRREHVLQVAAKPEQFVPASAGRRFAQSRYEENGKQYLLRVLIEDIGEERWVVTVYPTSKVGKYWQGEES